MRNKRSLSAAAGLALVVLATAAPSGVRPANAKATVAAEPAAPPAEAATPAAALAAFLHALEKGDEAALKAVTSGDDKQQEWVRAEAGQWKSLTDLESAITKRYGQDYAGTDKGKVLKEQIVEARDEDLHEDLLKAKLGEAKADEVEVVLDDAAPSNRQGRLVRVGGAWKFDLASLANYMAPDDVPVLKAVGAAAAALAAEVSARKFASLDEAADAVDERLDAAVDGASKKPAAAPEGGAVNAGKGAKKPGR